MHPQFLYLHFVSTSILTFYCLGYFLGVLSGDSLGNSVGKRQMPREAMATLLAASQ
jgi:hypothetical protein